MPQCDTLLRPRLLWCAVVRCGVLWCAVVCFTQQTLQVWQVNTTAVRPSLGGYQLFMSSGGVGSKPLSVGD